MELLELTHCFADSDARLDGVLADLRLQRHRGCGRQSRGMAARAAEQIRRLRGFADKTALTQDDLEDVLNQALSPYESLVATVRRAHHNLNSILSALDEVQHAVEDRRIIRHLLKVGCSLAADACRKSALLMWVLARSFLQRVNLQIATWTTPVRANGYFGTSKVDGRNLP
ncbi:hypothetical protein [Paucibacter soli]|uniref:hypothetical protein n=1 Tax=Paucibacter soli TaxID=3133433 RepID=UPI00309F7D8B